MAMLILSVMASYFYLRTAWRQGLFIGVAVALTILKNAARIVTLALRGAYVDPGFLYGRLHSEGTEVFFLLSMAILAPVLWLLRRGESADHPAPVPISATLSAG
jgi:exosortase/archaeosortase family protein